MKYFKFFSPLFFFLILSFTFADTINTLKLPPIFTDNMVFQRDMKNPVWGWAKPGSKITVRFAKQDSTTKTGQDGKWKLDLRSMGAGGPYQLIVMDDQKNIILLQNILVGEVWLCSGQSNMEMPVGDGWGKVMNYEKETAEAVYPEIRLITINRKSYPMPIDEASTKGWVPCTPDSVNNFSAAAYFFGRELYKKLNVPIGLIHSSWGGTPAESWTSSEVLQKLSDFSSRVQPSMTLEQAKQAYDEKTAKWYLMIKENDLGYQNILQPWFIPIAYESDWKEMKLPTIWEDAGLKDYDGIVWFRKIVDIPDNWLGKDITLHLGTVDDIDNTWFNGKPVGGMFLRTDKRDYIIPGSMVSYGKNTIVVRVLDIGYSGGIYGKPENMNLELKYNNNTFTIPLAGNWDYKESVELKNLPSLPREIGSPYQLSSLYNGMIAPLIPFGIRGVIWYQGESNGSRAYQYRTLFPTMITDWRSRWNEGDLPFYYVQLASWLESKPEPVEENWGELREAQLMTLSLPNTGMAVAVDIGDAKDIHPKNKQEVGRRLALIALAKNYGKGVEYSGPIYKSMEIEKNKIRLSFNHVGKGLVAKDNEPLKGFAIAGEDKKFVWADAVINGNTIIVSSDKVANPVAVRYAWAYNPVCNLFNKDSLPASPFRTDTWPGITVNNK